MSWKLLRPMLIVCLALFVLGTGLIDRGGIPVVVDGVRVAADDPRFSVSYSWSLLIGGRGLRMFPRTRSDREY